MPFAVIARCLGWFDVISDPGIVHYVTEALVAVGDGWRTKVGDTIRLRWRSCLSELRAAAIFTGRLRADGRVNLAQFTRACEANRILRR